MNIDGMVHVNINCTNYARSKAFYEMLGFEEVWQVPATNSAEVNAAVGMSNYRVTGHHETHGASLIDLLQWHEPRITHPRTPICIVPVCLRCAAVTYRLTTIIWWRKVWKCSRHRQRVCQCQ